MQAVSFQDQIQAKLEAGESLVAVSTMPALANIPDATRCQLCRDGKIPCVRLGRRYYSFPDLVANALAANTTSPAPLVVPRMATISEEEIDRAYVAARKDRLAAMRKK